MAPPLAEQADQLGDHAAVGVLHDDHVLAAGEPRDVAVPLRLAVGRVAHLGDDQVDVVGQREVHRLEVEEVARHDDLPPDRPGVGARVVGELGEVPLDREALERVVVAEERRGLAAGLEVEPLLEQPLAVVEGAEVDAVERRVPPVGRLLLEVGAEPLHAVLAEARAVLERAHRQLGLVELDAVDAGVDLDPDHGLEVLAPDRVVAVHVEALVLAVGALHPVRVARLLVDVADHALLDQVGDRLVVAVDEAVGK